MNQETGRAAPYETAARRLAEDEDAIARVPCVFFFSSRRRHTRFDCDWSSDVCSSDLRRNPRRGWLIGIAAGALALAAVAGVGLLGPALPLVDRNGVWIDTVKRGQKIGRASCRERV